MQQGVVTVVTLQDDTRLHYYMQSRHLWRCVCAGRVRAYDRCKQDWHSDPHAMSNLLPATVRHGKE